MKKFHQFVRIQQGPVNACIVDLLSGSVFQVPNEVVDTFDAGLYHELPEFLEVAHAENLIIDIDPAHWIPLNDTDTTSTTKDHKEISIELHIEEGVNLNRILHAFQKYPIFKIFYYSDSIPAQIHSSIPIELKKKDFSRCIDLASVDGNFNKAPEFMVCFNKRYNSCWGTTVAITADGKIRPCVHSVTEIGSIERDLDNIDDLLDRMRPYWEFTKDKVKKCRECEFRYVCFDCREIAMRDCGEMNAPNPLCNYDPHTGEWEDQKNDNKNF